MAGAEIDEKKWILDRLAGIIIKKCPAEGSFTPPGMQTTMLTRRNISGFSSHCLEQPLAALCVRGHKIITMGQNEYHLRPGKILINCMDIPSMFEVVEASEQNPLLTILFLLDKKILADLAFEMPPLEFAEPYSGGASAIMDGQRDLLNGFLRLARLIDRPEGAAILAPLALRELHYFLLSGPCGPMIRDIFIGSPKDNRILEAISWLKKRLDGPIAIEALARKVNMSVSSLHRHFKEMTGFSPLQYHKQLRLYEAQRLMIAENERADAAALAVGYESAAQFNREYKRMFGESPRRHTNRRKKP